MTSVDKKKKMSRSFKSHIKLEVSIRRPIGESRRWICAYLGLRVPGRGGGGVQDARIPKWEWSARE